MIGEIIKTSAPFSNDASLARDVGDCVAKTVFKISHKVPQKGSTTFLTLASVLSKTLADKMPNQIKDEKTGEIYEVVKNFQVTTRYGEDKIPYLLKSNNKYVVMLIRYKFSDFQAAKNFGPDWKDMVYVYALIDGLKKMYNEQFEYAGWIVFINAYNLDDEFKFELDISKMNECLNQADENYTLIKKMIAKRTVPINNCTYCEYFSFCPYTDKDAKANDVKDIDETTELQLNVLIEEEKEIRKKIKNFVKKHIADGVNTLKGKNLTFKIIPSYTVKNLSDKEAEKLIEEGLIVKDYYISSAREL